MAKWHYEITAKKRIKTISKREYLIDKVVKIEENGKTYFENDAYNKGKESWILNISFFIILILFFVLYSFNTLPEQFIFWEKTNSLSAIINNAFNISGILLPLMISYPISNLLDRFFRFGGCGNKLYILVFCTVIGFVAAAIIQIKGIETPSTYIFGMIGLLLTWTS